MFTSNHQQHFTVSEFSTQQWAGHENEAGGGENQLWQQIGMMTTNMENKAQ